MSSKESRIAAHVCSDGWLDILEKNICRLSKVENIIEIEKDTKYCRQNKFCCKSQKYEQRRISSN